MAVQKEYQGIALYRANCHTGECGWIFEQHIDGFELDKNESAQMYKEARAHVEETGHKVRIGREQQWILFKEGKSG